MSLDSLINKAVAKQSTTKPIKKRNAQPEAIDQERVIKWARDNENNYPFLWMLHSSLNGLKRTKNAQGKAKAQGMLSGVPDLFLPVPQSSYHGLYIEMKSEKGRVSVSQSRFLSVTNELGYQSIVCYSSEDAIEKIKEYLKNANHG